MAGDERRQGGGRYWFTFTASLGRRHDSFNSATLLLATFHALRLVIALEKLHSWNHAATSDCILEAQAFLFV